MTADSRGKELLACKADSFSSRFVIPAEDAGFWKYVYAQLDLWGNLAQHLKHLIPADVYPFWQDSKMALSIDQSLKMEPHPIDCKTYAPPTKPSSSVRNGRLPEDMISLIASFNDEAVHCNACLVVSFNITFLAKCSTPSTRKQFFEIQKEVIEEGGQCTPRMMSADKQTLESCMKSPKDLSGSRQYPLQSTRAFRICTFESDQSSLNLIKKTELQLKENEESIQRSQASIKDQQDTLQRTQASIKEQQEQLVEIKDTSRGLQQIVDARKQDVVYLKQIFEAM